MNRCSITSAANPAIHHPRTVLHTTTLVPCRQCPEPTRAPTPRQENPNDDARAAPPNTEPRAHRALIQSARAENETQKGHNRKSTHAESSSLVKRHRWRSMSGTETITLQTHRNTRGRDTDTRTRQVLARRQRQKEEKRCGRCGRCPRLFPAHTVLLIDKTRRPPCADEHQPPPMGTLGLLQLGYGATAPFLHHAQTSILITNRTPTGVPPPTNQKQGGTGRKPHTSTTRPNQPKHTPPLGRTYLTPPSPTRTNTPHNPKNHPHSSSPATTTPP